MHEGDDDDQTTLSITNAASAPAEDLDASVAAGEATGDANGDGFFGVSSGDGLVPGDTDDTDISVELTTDEAGRKSGTLTINFVSDGTQIPGDGTTTELPSQTVTVSGNVYRLAKAFISAPSYVHVGDPTDVPITIENIASNDGYSEDLIASVAGTTGNVAATGTVQDLLPGESSNAIRVSVPTDDAGTNAVSGTLSIDFVSDGDPIDGLGQTVLPQQTSQIDITVDNYVNPVLEVESPGTLISTHQDLEGQPPNGLQTYALDLGVVPLDSGPIDSTVAVKNDLSLNLPGDFLVEKSIIPVSIFGPLQWRFSDDFYLTSSPLVPDFQDLFPRVVTFDPNQVGTFSAVVEFDTAGVFPDLNFSETRLPSPTITTLRITATVVGPPSLVNDNPLTLPPGSTAPITDSLLEFSDTLSLPPQVSFMVTTAPVNGVLLLNGLPLTSLTGTGGATALSGLSVTSFTQADIDNGLVAYQETVPDAASDSFSFTVSDSAGAETSGQFQISITTACYCRGTLILTEWGEVPIEELSIGDQVMTISGEAKPIRWIGWRAYDGRFIATSGGTLPIRVTASALADGVPARDLWLSPEHSLYIDGFLVQAKHLVNGRTIVQAEAIEKVEYFHVELDDHDVIFADGTPTETYVDCDNRLIFANGVEHDGLYPNDERLRWSFCAPRLEWEDPELGEIRARVLERAAAMAERANDDPDLHLVVDGQVLAPQRLGGGAYCFCIPAGADVVLLSSRSIVPADLKLGSSDIRRLGVPVERLVLSDGHLSIEAWHDYTGLIDGFHLDEAAHRWTNGLAKIPGALLRPFSGAVTLDVYFIPNDLAYGT